MKTLSLMAGRFVFIGLFKNSPLLLKTWFRDNNVRSPLLLSNLLRSVKRQACCGRKAEPPRACGVSSSLCYHDSLPFPSLHAIMETNGPLFGLSHHILIGKHINRSCLDPCHDRIILPLELEHLILELRRFR